MANINQAKLTKILIIVGYKKREFEYVSLFASFFEDTEFTVKIRYSNFECFREIFFWQPDIVLLGQVNQAENIEIAKFSHNSGANVVVLNCEGTYDDRKDVYRFGKNTNHYVDLLVAWGEQHKEDALKYSNINPKKVVICSTPKFDFYVQRLFKKFPQYFNKSLTNKRKKTICISTSYASADNTWEEMKHNFVVQQLGKEKFERFTSSQKILREKFIELAISLNRMKKYNIIFRPHPLESLDYYKTKLAHYNISIDNSIYPSYLLPSLDLLIHRSSTLATEAWITNVPTLSYDPINNYDDEMLPFTQYEVILHSLRDVLTFIKNEKYIRNKKKDNEKKDEFLYHWFGYKRSNRIFSSQKLIRAFRLLQKRKKRRLFHPYVMISLILEILSILFRKNHAYEVIAMKKGNAYKEVVRDNYIEEHDYRKKIAFFRRYIS